MKPKKLYQIIRIRRRQLGMTQMEFAKKAGISQGLISKLDNNKIDPNFSLIIQMLDALGFTLTVGYKMEADK